MRFIAVFGMVCIPFFIILVITYGIIKGVKVYDAFCRGAKQGLELIFRLVPFICAMTVAIGVLRDSGLLGVISALIGKPLEIFGIPPQIIQLYVIRPFSGSASLGILADILRNEGINSHVADIASTMMASTETTFYTIALYFGSVGITKTRYAIPVAMICDLAAMLAAVITCGVILG